MKVYLAGPMNGIKDYNIPAFDAAAAVLVEQGHIVSSPAHLARLHKLLEQDLTDAERYSKAMRVDITELLLCEAVYVLPGYKDSRGCKVEMAIADILSMPIIEYETGERV